MNIKLLVITSMYISSIIAMDTLPPIADATFLLWCGRLTCTEIKREQIFNVTPRQFLGIEEPVIPQGCFYLQQNQILSGLGPQKTIPSEVWFTDNDHTICDRRIAGRWRSLEYNNQPSDPSCELYEKPAVIPLNYFGRQHINRLFQCPNCYRIEPTRGIPFELYPNAIPCDDNCCLYAGIAANPSEHIWIAAYPYTLSHENDDTKTTFPLQVLWVESCKEPIKLCEFMLPGKTYTNIEQSIAIKFINNNNFQVYYDASGRMYESKDFTLMTPSSLVQIIQSELIDHREQPSLCVITYALDRIKNVASHIESSVLQKWYSAYYIQCTTGSLEQHQLASLSQEMHTVIAGLH